MSAAAVVAVVRRDPLRAAVLAIAAVTAVSGLTQLVAPAFVLGIIEASTSDVARHLFAIVGMFMAIVGGMVLHALLAGRDQPTVLLWGTLQKVGASVAVAAGVGRGLFAATALTIAAFDLVSAAVMGRLWLRTRP